MGTILNRFVSEKHTTFRVKAKFCGKKLGQYYSVDISPMTEHSRMFLLCFRVLISIQIYKNVYMHDIDARSVDVTPHIILDMNSKITHAVRCEYKER